MNKRQKRYVEDVVYGKKKRILHILSLIGRYTILVLMALFFMFPVIYMIVVSFQSDLAAVSPSSIIPRLEDFSLSGYKDFFHRASFFKGIYQISPRSKTQIRLLLLCPLPLGKLCREGRRYSEETVS